MKTQLFTNLFWGGLLFLVSCSNNSDYQPFVPSLPPITQTGANTFGAVVDGKVFIPKTSYPSNPGGGIIKGLDFMNEHRINLAKHLLRNHAYQQYTITSIGLESGFNSRSAFYHTFKKHTGVTPSAYQKQ